MDKFSQVSQIMFWVIKLRACTQRIVGSPKWSLVLKYEAELRKNTYKYIRTGEATDIGDAINKACRAPDLLAFHFVTPFSLGNFVLSSATTFLPDSPHVPLPPEPLVARPGQRPGKGDGKDSRKCRVAAVLPTPFSKLCVSW